MNPIDVAILIFDGVEVLDFSGPFEVLATARPGANDLPPLFRVFAVAQTSRPVICTGGLRVLPDCTLADCPPTQITIVPGGQGTRREVTNPMIIDWVRSRAPRTGSNNILASVCTGAFLLAAAGLLDGKRATTHWASVDRLARDFPKVNVVADQRIVSEGSIVTSAGISAGIDMALELVQRLCDGADGASRSDAVRFTARRMEYDWPRSPNLGT